MDIYLGFIGVGEVLFFLVEVCLLDFYGGLWWECDVLVFDFVYCYGLLGYLVIFDYLCVWGWLCVVFCLYVGYLFSLYLVVVLCLGWVEVMLLVFWLFDDFVGVLLFFLGLVGLL